MSLYVNINRQQIADGTFRLKSFRKTDGQASEFGGVKRYQLDYQAEVEYLRDVKGMGLFGLAAVTKYKQGQVVKEKGSLAFERTEKGWKALDGKLY